jgi:predicted nucleic acid-binding protein
VSVYYLDTSAVVKRYADELGSEWIRQIATARPSYLLISSRFLIVETVSALARRLREKLITPKVYRDSLAAFEDDCQFEYHLIEVTAETVNVARDLVGRHPLRAYDAVHLASALSTAKFFRPAELPEPVFLSADDRLVQAAEAEGLVADNPNRYP